MAQMSTAVVAAPLRLTGHPLQRCGARAVTRLVGREAAEGVTLADLDRVADTVTADIVRAAVAAKDTAHYDWWKVLLALFPNSPATHAARSRDPGELRARIAAMFVPDTAPQEAMLPCAFCEYPAGAVWGKDKLPMFDTPKAVNTLPPRLAGWPVCRACRIAVWALPYGAWVTAGSATVLMCPDDAVERQFTERNMDRGARIRHAGFTGLGAAASAETVTLAALREHARHGRAGATLWLFKNDNQESWLRVTAARGGIPAFLRRMFADPACRAGWGALQSALTRRDKNGDVTANGIAEAAKTLFDPADRPGAPPADRLLRVLRAQAGSIEKRTARTLTAWRALCRLYLEVMHGMDVNQVKPASELITAWIMQDPNRRGRFTRYWKVSGNAYELQKLLNEASARLYLAGIQPPDITTVAPPLFAQDTNGWRLRGLLYFDVLAGLVSRGVQVGQRAEENEENRGDQDPVWDPDPLSGQLSEEYA